MGVGVDVDVVVGVEVEVEVEVDAELEVEVEAEAEVVAINPSTTSILKGRSISRRCVKYSLLSVKNKSRRGSTEGGCFWSYHCKTARSTGARLSTMRSASLDPKTRSRSVRVWPPPEANISVESPSMTRKMR